MIKNLIKCIVNKIVNIVNKIFSKLTIYIQLFTNKIKIFIYPSLISLPALQLLVSASLSTPLPQADGKQSNHPACPTPASRPPAGGEKVGAALTIPTAGEGDLRYRRG